MKMCPSMSDQELLPPKKRGGAESNTEPVSFSTVLEASWKEAGGFTPAPMHSSKEKRVYQSSVQWMLAAFVFSSS